MPIQGIIDGFCDPEDRAKHVILFGQGDHYDLVVDGYTAWSSNEALAVAQTVFGRAIKVYFPKPEGWVSVASTCQASVGPLEVIHVGNRLLADWLVIESDTST